MKTAEEWTEIGQRETDKLPHDVETSVMTQWGLRFVKRIQRDALSEALKVAEDYDGKGLDSGGYYSQLRDGKKTQSDIVKGLKALLNE